MWTNKATHVLYDAQDSYTRLLAEGDLSPYVPRRHRLQATEEQHAPCSDFIYEDRTERNYTQGKMCKANFIISLLFFLI